MTTPCHKCGFDNDATAAECSRCCVIFAKIRTRREEELPPPETPDADEVVSELLLSEGEESGSASRIGKWIAVAVMALWGAVLLFSGLETEAAGKGLLHLVNLPFHEAGHIFFRPFGQFVTSLGGTLGQLLIPLVCLGTLLVKTRDPFGAAVCLWWEGENFMDIAPYINDARAGEMPLLGGNTGSSSPYGFHDWEYLLTETGLLRYDHHIALLAHALGAILMALAVAWCLLLLRRQGVRG